MMDGEPAPPADRQGSALVADALLCGPVPEDPRAGRRPYTPLAMALVSLFIAYHVVAVLAHNSPARYLAGRLARHAGTESYLRAAGTATSWGVFAPEPPRNNLFLRVAVVDAQGHEQDLGLDVHGARRHPYLLYDRRAKINRQLVHWPPYRAPYAAWVCRDWERRHGEPAREARLSPFATTVPRPEEAYRVMGYDPLALPVAEEAPQVFPCASTPHGQLTPRLRARYGLSPAPAPFVDVRRDTWWMRHGARPGGEAAAPAEGRRGLE